MSDRPDPIDLATFQRVELRVGDVLEARVNEGAREPSYILRIDFGPELGERTSSAKLTERYAPEELVGRQVVAVCNFPPLRVGGVKSEVLVIGAVTETDGVVLLIPGAPVPPGTRIA